MHALKPFAANSIAVSASLKPGNGFLDIEFQLSDPLGQVQDSLTPGQWKTWARADDLWKTTCFEAFFGAPGDPAYYEFNLSPGSERWNLYSFDDYRAPLPPRASDDFNLQDITMSKNAMKCKLIGKIQTFEFSLTAVIRTAAGVGYFAVKHAGQKPDFHLRESFRRP